MRNIRNLFIILLVSIMAMGCGTSGKSTDTPATTLTIGLDDEFPPMGFRDENGELVGFDIDMAKAACDKMGYEVKFQPIDWASKEIELKSKRIDLLWNGLTITEERKQNMLFTNPYLKNKQVIMVKSDSGIKSKADLAGKILGLQKESSAEDAVDADPTTKNSLGGDIVKFDTNILAFADLDIGRIDAVVVDEIVAKYHLTTSDKNFELLAEDFGDEDYGVGMRLEDTDLLQKLQKALDDMNADGTSAQISKNWFGEDIVVK